MDTLLDDHLEHFFVPVRRPYHVWMELILGLYYLAVLFGMGYWFMQQSNRDLILVKLAFLSYFVLPPFIYLIRWRETSLRHDQQQTPASFSELTTLVPIIALTSSFALALGALLCLTVLSTNGQWLYGMLFAWGSILQFAYLYHLYRTQKKILNLLKRPSQ